MQHWAVMGLNLSLKVLEKSEVIDPTTQQWILFSEKNRLADLSIDLTLLIHNIPKWSDKL